MAWTQIIIALLIGWLVLPTLVGKVRAMSGRGE